LQGQTSKHLREIQVGLLKRRSPSSVVEICHSILMYYLCTTYVLLKNIVSFFQILVHIIYRIVRQFDPTCLTVGNPLPQRLCARFLSIGNCHTVRPPSGNLNIGLERAKDRSGKGVGWDFTRKRFCRTGGGLPFGKCLLSRQPENSFPSLVFCALHPSLDLPDGTD
jgi:hypothetical protein